MVTPTEQLRNFFGSGPEWDAQVKLWGNGKSEQAAVAEQHDSAESHIQSIRQLNKPLPRTADGRIDYTSRDVYEVSRKDFTEKNLEANRWQETANILRWATTFSIGGVFLAAMTMGAAAGTWAAIKSAGLLSLPTVAAAAPMLIPAGIAVVAAAGLFYASQKARKLSTEKMFDDSEFRNQRHAQLVGKAVEQERKESLGSAQSWQVRIGRDAAQQQSWRDSIIESTAEEIAGPAL